MNSKAPKLLRIFSRSFDAKLLRSHEVAGLKYNAKRLEYLYRNAKVSSQQDDLELQVALSGREVSSFDLDRHEGTKDPVYTSLGLRLFLMENYYRKQGKIHFSFGSNSAYLVDNLADKSLTQPEAANESAGAKRAKQSGEGTSYGGLDELISRYGKFWSIKSSLMSRVNAQIAAKENSFSKFVELCSGIEQLSVSKEPVNIVYNSLKRLEFENNAHLKHKFGSHFALRANGEKYTAFTLSYLSLLNATAVAYTSAHVHYNELKQLTEIDHPVIANTKLRLIDVSNDESLDLDQVSKLYNAQKDLYMVTPCSRLQDRVLHEKHGLNTEISSSYLTPLFDINGKLNEAILPADFAKSDSVASIYEQIVAKLELHTSSTERSRGPEHELYNVGLVAEKTFLHYQDTKIALGEIVNGTECLLSDLENMFAAFTRHASENSYELVLANGEVQTKVANLIKLHKFGNSQKLSVLAIPQLKYTNNADGNHGKLGFFMKRTNHSFGDFALKKFISESPPGKTDIGMDVSPDVVRGMLSNVDANNTVLLSSSLIRQEDTLHKLIFYFQKLCYQLIVDMGNRNEFPMSLKQPLDLLPKRSTAFDKYMGLKARNLVKVMRKNGNLQEQNDTFIEFCDIFFSSFLPYINGRASKYGQVLAFQKYVASYAAVLLYSVQTRYPLLSRQHHTNFSLNLDGFQTKVPVNPSYLKIGENIQKLCSAFVDLGIHSGDMQDKADVSTAGLRLLGNKDYVARVVSKANELKNVQRVVYVDIYDREEHIELVEALEDTISRFMEDFEGLCGLQVVYEPGFVLQSSDSVVYKTSVKFDDKVDMVFNVIEQDAANSGESGLVTEALQRLQVENLVTCR